MTTIRSCRALRSSITTELDDNGETLGRDIVYDDTTTRAETYEDGGLRQAVLQDASIGNGIMPWSSIKRNYDDKGRITDYLKVQDEGSMLSISTEYQFGAISRIVKEDLGANGGPSEAKPWAKIETYYNEDGSVWNKSVTLDSGIHASKHYTNGVLTFSARYDLDANGEASDANPWHKIEFWYDENGVIDARVEYRDDSLTKYHHYEAGELQFISLIDKTGVPGEASGVKDWHVKQTTFDEFGNMYSKSTSYDNNDSTTLYFEDGQRTKKLEVDGDESETWVRRETIYGADGEIVEVITYDEWPVVEDSLVLV